MEKFYIIKGSTLDRLADAIRSVKEDTKQYTPEEMIEEILTILESALYVLVGSDGKEIPAVFVENDTRFTAEANDIRLGKVAASQNGVVEGTLEV